MAGTEVDSGPWEVGNETRLGLPNSLSRTGRRGSRGSPQDPWSPDVAPSASERRGSEDGTPEPSLCTSSHVRISAPVNGHRTVQGVCLHQSLGCCPFLSTGLELSQVWGEQ